MLNRSASLVMSTSVLIALPGKLDIKRHSPSILFLPVNHLWLMHDVRQDTRNFIFSWLKYNISMIKHDHV